jgi:hypothetical protein
MTTTIEIPAYDFFRKDNSSLVRLLKVVRKAGPEGIGTRMLCVEAFGSKSYGLRVIARAELEGYITRTGKYNKKGGGPKRINRITDKGRLLLDQLNKK